MSGVFYLINTPDLLLFNLTLCNDDKNKSYWDDFDQFHSNIKNNGTKIRPRALHDSLRLLKGFWLSKRSSLNHLLTNNEEVNPFYNNFISDTVYEEVLVKKAEDLPGRWKGSDPKSITIPKDHSLNNFVLGSPLSTLNKSQLLL